MIKNLTGIELEQFKSNFKIESYWAPTTFISPIDNQKYAIAMGTPWVPIPHDMTSQEVHDKWIKKTFIKPTNKIEVKVPATRGKTLYTVSFSTKWNCTCSGFRFKGSCKHLEIVKEGLKQKFK
jgi:hypothetical protein